MSAIFESTNMRAVKYAERIFDCVAVSDIENGTFGYLNGLATGYTGDKVYNFVVGAGTDPHMIVVANNPAWDEDESKLTNQRRDKYVIKAGTVFRAFVLHESDEFALDINGFTSATRSVVTGVTDFKTTATYVSVDGTTGKLVAAASKPESGTVIGQIMRKRATGAKIVTPTRTYGAGHDMYEIKVLAVYTAA